MSSSSSYLCDENLFNEIKRLQSCWNAESNKYCTNAMHSPPEYVHFYNDLADSYAKASIACEKYFLSCNIVEFFRELLYLGYFYEVQQLKQFVTNPSTLKEVLLLMLEHNVEFSDEEILI